MKLFSLLIACSGWLTACDTPKTALPLTGTWQLVTATIIEKDDTLITDYTTGKKFIKIINDSHFAFTGHDVHQGADSTGFFSAGSGSYTLTDSTYTEHLEFCSARDWENHDFSFTVSINGDTLLQKGTEVVEASGINRLNIEKYVRVK